MLSELLTYAKRNKYHLVIGEYVPSNKNQIVKDLYLNNGFKLELIDSISREFSHNLDAINTAPRWITITNHDLEDKYAYN